MGHPARDNAFEVIIRVHLDTGGRVAGEDLRFPPSPAVSDPTPLQWRPVSKARELAGRVDLSDNCAPSQRRASTMSAVHHSS